MIQAYRRGLLRKSLPHGERSRLREEVLLESVEMEMLADAGDRSYSVTASLLGGADLGNNRKKLLQELSSGMQYHELIKISDFDGAAQHQYENSSLAATSLYDLMAQAGWVTGVNPENRDG